MNRGTMPAMLESTEHQHEGLALSARGMIVEVAATGARVVDRVSLDVACGEIVGLVGESGCGKSTFALSLMGFTRPGLRLAGGSVELGGRSLLELDQRDREAQWGSKVSYVPQDPVTALNPAMKLGTQLSEVLTAHGFSGTASERHERVVQALRDVDLADDPQRVLGSYPHQLSGGQQQRISISMAIVNRPDLIIMDEPTTGLDVTTQDYVLRTVRDVAGLHGAGIIYVTHDLAVVSQLADRVLVMYAGRAAELGRTQEVLNSSQHPYVVGLLQAVPDLVKHQALVGIEGGAPDPGAPVARCHYADRCPIAIDRCRAEEPAPLAVTGTHSAWCFRAGQSTAVERPLEERAPSQGPSPEVLLSVQGLTASYGKKEILHDINLDIPYGRSIALVGESGSGKTTLARCIGGLHTEFSGEIRLSGQVLEPNARKRSEFQRKSIQYIFQNAFSAFHPRRSIADSIAAPLRQVQPDLSRSEIDDRVDAALQTVAFSPRLRGRQPNQLSGGQRQRAAIARALALEPSVLVCDEVTSALDVSVQAVIVELLQELQEQSSLTMLFVTHNLALVPNIADLIAVMADGVIVERGTVDEVLEQPSAPETKALLDHLPHLKIGQEIPHGITMTPSVDERIKSE